MKTGTETYLLRVLLSVEDSAPLAWLEVKLMTLPPPALSRSGKKPTRGAGGYYSWGIARFFVLNDPVVRRELKKERIGEGVETDAATLMSGSHSQGLCRQQHATERLVPIGNPREMREVEAGYCGLFERALFRSRLRKEYLHRARRRITR